MCPIRTIGKLVVVTLLSAACAAVPPAAASASVPTVEPTDAASRSACATRVLALLGDAINARDATAIGRVIGPGPSLSQAFQWVSLTGVTNETEYSADGARRLLLQHAAQGEHWKLLTVRAGDGPSWHGGVDAELHLERQLAGGSVVKTGGKTALSCIGSAIYVLSLGDE